MLELGIWRGTFWEPRRYRPNYTKVPLTSFHAVNYRPCNFFFFCFFFNVPLFGICKLAADQQLFFICHSFSKKSINSSTSKFEARCKSFGLGVLLLYVLTCTHSTYVESSWSSGCSPISLTFWNTGVTLDWVLSNLEGSYVWQLAFKIYIFKYIKFIYLFLTSLYFHKKTNLKGIKSLRYCLIF